MLPTLPQDDSSARSRVSWLSADGQTLRYRGQHARFGVSPATSSRCNSILTVHLFVVEQQTDLVLAFVCFLSRVQTVVAYLDRNQIRFRAGTLMPFPFRFKNKLYKTVVKFMTSMFLLQNAERSPLQRVQPRQSAEVSRHPALHSVHYKTLRTLRDGFLSVLVSLFYRYRLFCTKDSASGKESFDHIGFVGHAKADYQPFLSRVVRTNMMEMFLGVRTSLEESAIKNYLFDNIAYKKLIAKAKLLGMLAWLMCLL